MKYRVYNSKTCKCVEVEATSPEKALQKFQHDNLVHFLSFMQSLRLWLQDRIRIANTTSMKAAATHNDTAFDRAAHQQEAFQEVQRKVAQLEEEYETLFSTPGE